MRSKNREILLSLILLVLSLTVAIAFAACTPTIQTIKADGAPNVTSNVTLAPTNVTVNSINTHIAVGADLQHSPKVSTDLTWNAANQNLQVKIKATGLAPNSKHLVHIHLGSCAKNTMGQMLYPLTPLKGNAHGNGTSETTITGVLKGIPANGWYINVHNGQTLNTALEARPIACGDVTTSQTAIQANQTVHLALMATTAPDEDVHGTASISFKNNAVVVSLAISGLAPNTRHMAHIHVGSCQSQGPVLYPLQPVVADAQGNSTTQTTINVNNLSNLPAAQFYINVHEAGTKDGMMTPQGFNPLVCGNIELLRQGSK